MNKQRVAEIIATAGNEALGVEFQPEVDYPDARFGDYSSNIAFKLAGELQKSPRELAEAIKTKISDELIADVRVEGAGFLNIVLTEEAWVAMLNRFFKDQKLISVVTTEPRRVMVEYGQPNTHKLPHIGHLYSYIAGDSIARILEAAGSTVMRVNYQGDIGPHVAKCLYVWRKRNKPKPDSLQERVALLQECYQEGSLLYESDEEAQQAIKALNQGLYSGEDEQIKKDWEETKAWSLDFYRDLEDQLHIKQERYYLESSVWERGKQTVLDHLGGVFEESDQAVIFPGEKAGLHNRVFITSQGTPTYEAKDLGLNQIKAQDWPFDLSLITTAVEQNDYFNVVITALEQVAPHLKNKVKHIGFGLVQLVGVKMSSRTGNIISAPDLLEEVKERALSVVRSRTELSAEERSAIAHEVALAAIKYAFLKSGLGTNILFDPKRALSLQGESGPYLQYTYTRAWSVLQKGGSIDQKPEGQLSQEERELLRQITRFSEVVDRAAQEFAPQQICHYLFELAQQFNLFYEKNRIVGDEKEVLRLQITTLVTKVMESGLGLLGITPLKRM